MRAAVVGADGRYEVVAVPDPSPGPGELLLRVTACGLCGSDLTARAAMPEGTIMGHEFCGEVVGVGAGLTGWCAGDRAAVLPVLACGRCDWCASGQVAHCPSALPVPALMKEASISFAVYYTSEEFTVVIAAFERGEIDPSPLLARRLDLSLINDAFGDLACSAAAGKILLSP